jgi:hypothetical protein
VRTPKEIDIRSVNYNPDKSEEESTKSLACIGINQGKYWVYCPEDAPQSLNERIWVVIRFYLNSSTGESGYKLDIGDTLKIGRCQFLVKELVIDMMKAAKEAIVANTNVKVQQEQVQVQAQEQPKATDKAPEITNLEVKPNEQLKCRICLSEDNSTENPLIQSPCACMGTVKWFHIECITQWLKSQITERNTDYTTSYSWDKFKCELCKAQYPGICNTLNPKIILPCQTGQNKRFSASPDHSPIICCSKV